MLCDVCGYNVKIEIFECHVRQIHGHNAATFRPSELKKLGSRIKECLLNTDKKSSGENYDPKTF